MTYRKQTWRDYDDTKTEIQNLNNGAVVTPERMNHIETGIANSANKEEVTAQLAQTANGIKPNHSVWTEFEQRGVNVKWFGAKGDGLTDDSVPIKNALEFTKEINGKLLFERGKVYSVKQAVNIEITDEKSFEIDLNSSTIDFTNGGHWLIGSEGGTPYKTTTLGTDLVRGKTKFDVLDASGVVKGDLVKVTSPVEWDSGINLIQTYTIGDIVGNTLYVDGVIVGDITEQQKVEAGKTEDVKVEFYKLSSNLVIKNGTFMSTTRDDSGTLVGVRGQENFLIEDITIKQPRNFGVYIQHCGTGKVVNCRTIDHGYVHKDEGYTNNPEISPGFGYGFASAHSYVTHFIGCHSFSGWHGFDIPRGQSFAFFDNCVIHKDAHGISSHEGSWVLHVSNSKVLGGLGITSRSAELIVVGCTFKTSLGAGISGNNTHQRLIVKGNIFDSDGHNPIYMSNEGYPSYCYSLEEPYSEVSSNSLLGVGKATQIRVRGKVVFTDNSLTFDKDNDTGYISIESANHTSRIVDISNNNFHNVGAQYPISVTGVTNDLAVSKNNLTGTSSLSNVALLYLLGSHEKVVMKDNNVLGVGFSYLTRVIGGYSNFELIQNNYVSEGWLIFAQTENAIVKNAINNTFKNGLNMGTVTITKDINNTTTSAD